MLRKSGIPAIVISILVPSPAFAVDWTYTPLGGIATELTGGYGAVADPSTGSVYNDGSDYSYPVILDSGSSGFLMSQTVTENFNVPLQSGQNYLETGIGGSEWENVTLPLAAYYSPASNPNPDNIATMTAYGTYTFESRQNDPFEGFIFFDVIGTPIIQNKVMVVTPGQSYNVVQGTLGFLTAQTTLQATAPVLPTKGLYHVPVTWTNFVNGTPVPSEGLNPVINGVTVRGPNGTPVANNWLFDSGAQFTIISPMYASQLGIDTSKPIRTIEGQGVGGSTVDFGEFQITEIDLPLSNGDRLVFDNPYVFVPLGDVSLPADLTGILGENLFMQSADSINPFTGLPKGIHAPLFAEWYLDGPGSQLVLYDPNAVAPLPVWDGATNNNWTTQASDVNWTGAPWSNNANRSTPNAATFALATPAAVTVNGNIDVGSITFTTGGWTLAAGTGVLAYGATGAINITTITGTDTINAIIADGSSFGSGGGFTGLVKSGDGILILGGANTYSGGTSVNSGTLLVNNTTGSATGSGPVTLNGGTLGGHGIISGAVFAGSSPHTIAPSAGLLVTTTGTLTVGGLTTNANTTLAFNLVKPNAAGGCDIIAVTGANGLALNGGAIQIANSATGPASLGYYKIIQYSGAIGGAGAASLTLPATVNNVAYTLDLTHDLGFIDIHRGFLGDVDDSGFVDVNDLATLALYWQQSGGWSQGNFLGDPLVDINDLAVLAANWQTGIADFGAAADAIPGTAPSFQDAVASIVFGGAGQVPEPASLALLGLGAVGLLVRRRAAGRHYS